MTIHILSPTPSADRVMATVEIYDLKMEMDLNTFNSKKILSARKARLYSSVLLS